jgi:hypothetical protein
VFLSKTNNDGVETIWKEIKSNITAFYMSQHIDRPWLFGVNDLHAKHKHNIIQINVVLNIRTWLENRYVISFVLLFFLCVIVDAFEHIFSNIFCVSRRFGARTREKQKQKPTHTFFFFCKLLHRPRIKECRSM